MLKKIVVLAGVLGSMTTLAAVGCSSSSNGATGGGGSDASSDDSGKKGKDGGTLSGDGGSSSDGGGKGDGGVTIDDDSGAIATGIDAGSDGGPISLDDGGTLTAPACYAIGSGIYLPNATAPMANQNKCSTTQVSGFYTACLDAAATTSTCDAFVSANGACATCIEGAASGTYPYPALVQLGTDSVEVNVLGCYAALSTGNATCKQNVASQAMCVDNTCNSCTTQSDYNSCEDYGYSDPGGCAASFPTDSTCVDAVTAAESGANLAKCGNGASTFQDTYTAVTNTLCGP